jgi:formylglycine-generating enzyme required for sulfatase activity
MGNNTSSTHPVGQKKPNAWGLFDMVGNTMQWCNDVGGLDTYEQSPVDDPPGPSGNGWRVTRGANIFCESPYCRSALRAFSKPDNRSYACGFRVAAVIPSGE